MNALRAARRRAQSCVVSATTARAAARARRERAYMLVQESRAAKRAEIEGLEGVQWTDFIEHDTTDSEGDGGEGN